MSEIEETELLKVDRANIVESAIEAGIKIAVVKEIPREYGVEQTSVMVPIGFKIETIDNQLQRPIRKEGFKSFDSVKSFCSYVNKHKSVDETIIVAHEDTGKVKAIINDDGIMTPSWCDFGAYLDLGFSKQWLTWYKNAYPKRGEFFTQEEFANFIEDNRSDLKVGKFKDGDGNEVVNLSALELSAVITNLNMTFEEKMSSKIDLVSGQTTFHFENEEVGKGSLTIPRQLFLAIPIYKSGDLFQIVLRLRHRMRGGSPKFYFIIDQIDLLKERAFDMICQRITDGNTGSEEKTNEQFIGTGIEVLKGTI